MASGDIKRIISIGVQNGDKEASKVTDFSITKLRRCMADNCREVYSNEIREYSIVFRIDGEIWHWNFEGCQKMRRSKKEKYITVDIGIPKDVWRNNSRLELEKYISMHVLSAFEGFIRKFKKDKIEIKSEQLIFDVKKALTQFIEND